MKYTVAQLKGFLGNEAGRHALQPESLRLDIPPAILSPHASGFRSAARCLCGQEFECVTQHSGKTPQGVMEVRQAMMADYADHFKQSMAQMIFALYDTVQ